MRLFMSYRREDSADVSGRIYDRLVAHFGEEAIFRDVDDIPMGVDYRAHLDDVLAGCDVELVVIGPRWLDSSDDSGQRRLDKPNDLVRLEVEAALGRGIPVVPLLVGGASMPAEHELPTAINRLAYRNATRVRSDPDFHTDMNRVVRGLEAHVTPPARASADRSTSADSGPVSSQAAAEMRFLRRWWRPGAGLLVALVVILVLVVESVATSLATVAVILALLAVAARYVAGRRWLSGAVAALPALGWVLAWIQSSIGEGVSLPEMLLYYTSYVPTVTLWFAVVTSLLAATWLVIDGLRGDSV